MVDRVVSTKMTEEEHTKLLDTCNREGCTPSSLIKDAIMKRISLEEKPRVKKPIDLLDALSRISKEKASS